MLCSFGWSLLRKFNLTQILLGKGKSITLIFKDNCGYSLILHLTSGSFLKVIRIIKSEKNISEHFVHCDFKSNWCILLVNGSLTYAWFFFNNIYWRFGKYLCIDSCRSFKCWHFCYIIFLKIALVNIATDLITKIFKYLEDVSGIYMFSIIPIPLKDQILL